MTVVTVTTVETLVNEVVDAYWEMGYRCVVETATINHRLRTTAGYAFYRDKRIEVNPHIGTLSQLKETILHEIAHLVAEQNYGVEGKGHGRIWKDVFTRGSRQLKWGYRPERTHYDKGLAAKKTTRKPRTLRCANSACSNHSGFKAGAQLKAYRKVCKLCESHLEEKLKGRWVSTRATQGYPSAYHQLTTGNPWLPGGPG